MLQDREALTKTERGALAVPPSRRARPAGAGMAAEAMDTVNCAALDAATIWPTRRLRAGLLAWPDRARRLAR